MVSQLEANLENASASSTNNGNRVEAEPRQAFEKLEYFYTGPEGASTPLGNADGFASTFRYLAITLIAMALFVICAVAFYQYSPPSSLLAAKPKQIEDFAADMTMIKARLDVVEASSNSRPEPQENGDHKEGKNEELRLQGFDTSIAQLNDHFDQLRNEASARDANIISRLDKLEKTVPTPVAMATPIWPPLGPDLASHRAEPRAFDEVTGAIDISRPTLPAFTIRHVQDGVAMVNGPEGLRPFSRGDIIPGAGIVQRIELSGHEWIVVTSLGIIKTTTRRHARSGGGATPRPPTIN